MIRHVVLLKLKENSPIEEIRTKIENLKNEIKEIKSIKTGKNIGFEEGASDLCIITDVENVKDLEIYAKHPKHKEVIEFIKPFVTERKVIDFNV